MTLHGPETETTNRTPSSPPRLNALRRFGRSYATLPAGIAGLAVLLAFAALALLAPTFIGPEQLDVTKATGQRLAAPTSDYLLGTDESGRSILMLVIWGARTSLTIGIIATVITMVLGSTIGLLAGHYQGWVGNVLMRITDWFIALPSLPMAISLAAVLGQGSASIIIAIAITSWTRTTRLVRAQTLAVGARPFIERAKVLGAGNVQVMLRHVLPNVVPLILVSSTLTVASAILDAATLTFLGLGDPTNVSWGSMLNAAFAQGAVTAGAWWYVLTPGVAILVVVLGFTLTGRAVEHVLNPRMAGER
ncbi:MAG: ABC transporter permease [Nocardioidaceae bacterium]